MLQLITNSIIQNEYNTNILIEIKMLLRHIDNIYLSKNVDKFMKIQLVVDMLN